jgi:adenylylsulfate kinase-like enzyme
MAFAVWITGLPGSGKSTIAQELAKRLTNTEYLRLDAIRSKFIKDPKFTDEERDRTYDLFVDEGIRVLGSGRNVLYDATAHKLAWRKKARENIKDFVEVYVKCPVNVCMDRESHREGGLVQADLYKKALERKASGKKFEKLGNVVGIDVEYEENANAEVVIDSSILGPKEAAEKIVSVLKKKGLV